MPHKLFYHWAKQKYLKSDTPNGDFVNDILFDRDFPWYHATTQKALSDYKDKVIFHLKKNHACPEAIETFEKMFKEFVEDMKHTYQARQQYYKEWRKKNPEKIKEYNRKYWERKSEVNG